MANSQTRVNIRNQAQLNGSVVIFQKNVASSAGEAIAWRVFENPRVAQTYAFVYPQHLYVGASDSFGVATAQLPAQPGQAFEVVAGNVLQLATAKVSAGAAIEVHNALGNGSISACIYRDNHLLSAKSGVAPGQKADFRFSDDIFIGVAADVAEGQLINSATVQAIDGRIGLQGLKSVEITITGGGGSPLQFVVTSTT